MSNCPGVADVKGMDKDDVVAVAAAVVSLMRGELWVVAMERERENDRLQENAGEVSKIDLRHLRTTSPSYDL